MNSKFRIQNSEFQKLAVVAVGSNLGESAKIVRDTLKRLERFSNRAVLKSSLWQTSPVDCPPGSPPFVNAAAALVPFADETPESLLHKLRALEKKAGRPPRKNLNEPRALDLDLIAFGAEIRHTPELTLPHPRAHLRRFVLEPLSEIAPDLVLPGQSLTVSRLLAGVPAGEMVTRLA